MKFCNLYVDATPKSTAYILEDEHGKTLHYESRKLDTKLTVNEAEYQALIEGVDYCLGNEFTDIDVYSDSEIVVKQLYGEYRARNNLQVYRDKALALLAKIDSWTIRHIIGIENPADYFSRKVLTDE